MQVGKQSRDCKSREAPLWFTENISLPRSNIDYLLKCLSIICRKLTSSQKRKTIRSFASNVLTNIYKNILNKHNTKTAQISLKIACLCHSIKINNNKHVYRQSRVQKTTGSAVEWAECSLIIGTGYWVQVFSFIFDSSVGLSVSKQSAGDSVPETLGSNPVYSRGRQLVSFRFENRLPVPEHQN